MKSNLTKFAQVAGIMLALALTLSCSSNDDNGGGTSSGGGGGISSPSGGGGGGSIINADNEAWVSSWETNGSSDPHQGFVFKQNGEGIELKSYDGSIWCRAYIVTYSISGNQFTWCRIREGYPNGQCSTLPYSISGNTVTLVDRGSSYTFTRTSGVNISGDCH